MRNNLLINFFVYFLVLTAFFSCSKDSAVKPNKEVPSEEVPTQMPTLVTTNPTSVTTTSISLGGKFENKGNVKITDRGICWSKKINPDVTNTKVGVISLSGSGEFTSLVTDLTPGETYYLRAYGIVKDGVVYGNQVVVKTIDIGVPIIATDSSIIIGKNTARFGGTIAHDGGSAIATQGVCYGLTPDPTIARNTVQSDDKNSRFTCTLEKLIPNTTYYVRAFATNARNTGYGKTIKFKTIVGGNMSYTIWKNANPSDDEANAYETITKAMDIAIFYYNTYSNIDKVLTIEYAPWISTADGSFSGHIRFGSERVYMNPGTCMHEITHTIGVGTVPLWWSGFDLMVNNIYTGKHANAIHQWITNDPNATITADGEAHFKPYQFNVPNAYQSTMDYINTALVMEGMRMDGLPIKE